MKYAEIAFRRQAPANNDGLFTFAIPKEQEKTALPGCIARASLRGTSQKALIVRIHENTPAFLTENLEEICSVPLIGKEAFFLAEAIAGKNFVPLARVLPLFLPKPVFENTGSPPEQITVRNLEESASAKLGSRMAKVLELLKNSGEMPIEDLKRKSGATLQTLAKLQEKKLIAMKSQEKFAKQFYVNPPNKIDLSSAQDTALQNLRDAGICLLFAPTGSGKSHLLRKLADDLLRAGKTVFFLLPEIGLTTEVLQKSEEAFGKEFTVLYHSRLSEGEKAEAFWRVRAGHARVIIGSRAALFLPFQELGLIVMEEEHEWTFKSDQSPRYHAKDVALRLASLLNARLVFCSATPSLETYFETKEGKYPLVTLPARFEPPRIRIADLKEETVAKNTLPLSRQMQLEITDCLKNRRQVLLFLNRRGLHRALICRDCGELSRCPECGISLVVHPGKGRDFFLCHQCGRVFAIPAGCTHCGSTNLFYSGSGTAKIEQLVSGLYPAHKVIRIDRDTTSGKSGFSELHERFQSGEGDILVGTQIVAKGLDFKNIGLVGILDADAGINIPDFRAAERSFQLLMQVAGRAGRRGQPATVILQTRLPKHPLYTALQNFDTRGFYDEELKLREHFFLPPYSRIAKLIFTARQKETAYRRARETEAALRLRLQEKPNAQRVDLSVAPSLNPKKHGKYFVNLLVTAKEPERLLALVPLHGCRVDIDPVDVVS